jgi:hypothetical protein
VVVITVYAAKSFLKRRFTRAEEVTAKSMKTLTKVSQNGFRERFQKLYERWRSVTTQRNCLEGNVMQTDVKLLISVKKSIPEISASY